jgi:hypothetical protein
VSKEKAFLITVPYSTFPATKFEAVRIVGFGPKVKVSQNNRFDIK